MTSTRSTLNATLLFVILGAAACGGGTSGTESENGGAAGANGVGEGGASQDSSGSSSTGDDRGAGGSDAQGDGSSGGGKGKGGDGSGGETGAADTTPDAFSFTPRDGVALGEQVVSDAMTVSGINAAAPIEVTGGEYSVDGGAFTDSAGTVESGQSVILRLTADTKVDTSTEATLTIGGVSATFTVTTVGDEVAPLAVIHFPPVNSYTNQPTMLVRGAAEDAEESEITAVTVNGIEAESSDGFATWQVVVPLEVGDNVLAVRTADAEGNEADAADATIQFNPLPNDLNLNSLVFDSASQRVLATTSYPSSLLSLDLSGTERTVVSSSGFNIDELGTGPELDFARNLTLDGENGRTFHLNSAGLDRAIFSVDLQSGDRTALITGSSPGSGPAYDLIRSFVFDADNDRFLVLDGFNGSVSNRDGIRLFGVDLVTLNRTRISGEEGNSTRGSGVRFDNVNAIALDSGNNRAVVVDVTPDALFAIDLDSGDRSLVSGSEGSSNTVVGDGADFTSLRETIALHPASNRAFVVDVNSVFAVDLTSGDRTLVSGATPAGDEVVGTGLPFTRIDSLAVNDAGTQLVVDDTEYATLVLVDVATGNREFLDDFQTGEGQPFERPESLLPGTSDDQLIVADQVTGIFFTTDLTTGDRSELFSVASVNEQANGLLLEEQTVIAAGKSENHILIAETESFEPRILALDPRTQELSLVSGEGDGTSRGTGLTLERPIDMVFVPGQGSTSDRAFVLDGDLNSLIVVDLDTGDRTLLSGRGDNGGPLVGEGPEFGSGTYSVTWDAARSRLIVGVTSFGHGALFAVDPTSGDREVLSGGVPGTDDVVGSGPAVEFPSSVVVDEANQRLIVADESTGALLAIDLASGDREVVSVAYELDESPPVGAGPELINPAALRFNAETQTLLVMDTGHKALLSVDLRTGERVIVSWAGNRTTDFLD